MNELRCSELALSFGSTRALDGVDLELSSRGITAIIGPNGAGKSTLVNVLTGFLRPTGGRCFLGERDITDLLPHQIASLGVSRTFQELRLISRLSAIENMLLSHPNQRGEGAVHALLGRGIAVNEKRNQEASVRLLGRMGLAEIASAPAGTLSYGQQKLLALACCLSTGASVLLLDEPVAGIAPEVTARVLDILRAAAEEGTTVVMIEHNLEAVRHSADRIVVMDCGKVIAHGPTREVFDRTEIMDVYLA